MLRGAMAKKPEPFNNPFDQLKALQKKEEPAQAKAPPPPPPREKKRSSDEEDAALFLQHVGEVAPVRSKKTHAAPKEPPKAEDLTIPTEEAESLARLAELVSGEGPFDLADSDEFIQGAIQGLDPGVLRKLRAGEFSSQGHLDLHGLTEAEAKPALEQFITQARVAGHRCVLVVTGRGLHSKDQIPVLKESVQRWLTRGRPSKQVLAFCSARPQHGGAGAVYVLLRR